MQPAATVCDELSAESLWGDLAGLNLAGYDDWDDEELQQVDVEAVVAQLCSTQQPDDAFEPLLQQLCSPDAPPYAIIGCDVWPQLANLLPWLLTSCQPGTAAAAEELLQQQLAPELLHCSPEPLAQLLGALLQPQLAHSACSTAAATAGAAADVSVQRGHVTAASSAGTTGPSTDSCSLGPGAWCVAATPCFPAQQVYGPSVLQFITRGLQKLGRQWHFLDKELSDQLCTAIVATLLQPLLQLTSSATQTATTAAAAAASQGRHDGHLNSSSWFQTLPQQQGLQQQQQLQRSRDDSSTQAQVSSAAAAAAGPPNQQASVRQDSPVQQGQAAAGTRQSQQQHSSNQLLDDTGDPVLLSHHTPPQNCHSPVQQQQQQQQQCHRGILPLCEQQQPSSHAAVPPQHPPVAEQLLQHDPSLSWWHRLNANNASSRPLKAAAVHQGLTHTLVHWAQQTAQQQTAPQQTAQQQERSVSSSSSQPDSTATDQQQQQPPGRGPQECCNAARNPQPYSSSSRHGASCVHVGDSHAAVRYGCCEQQAVTLVDCLALHCLAAFMSTHSGRQLLQGALLQEQQQQPSLQPEQQQQQVQRQDSQQQKPSDASATRSTGLTAEPEPAVFSRSAHTGAGRSSRPQPLSLALCRLQEWARLQAPTHPQSLAQQVQPDASWGPAQPAVCLAAAATAAASGAPAVSHLTAVPQQQALSGLAANCQIASAAGVAVPAGEAVVQAAAATAARAVQAYEEQQPWFDTTQP